MADSRNTLQSLWQPKHRHTNFGEVLLSVHAQGFRCHANTKIEFESPITAFCGLNGTGKSTLLQLAATAYRKADDAPRYYVYKFIVAGKLDSPFSTDASVTFEYVQPITSSGTPGVKAATISRGKSKWVGYKNQPERRVYFAGVGLYLPRVEEWKAVDAYARKMNVRGKTALAADVRAYVSRILGATYDGADAQDVKFRKKPEEVVTVERSGATYSELNMGCGEGRIYHIVRVLEALPDRSLVLLEEPETSLHPSAQHAFGTYLVDVCIRKRHQVLITTHSEYLMHALPSASRVFLQHTAEGLGAIRGIGVRQAMSLMTGLRAHHHLVLVEDDVAEAIVRELLRRYDNDFLRTVRLCIGGSANTIKEVMRFASAQKLPVCGVLDGDMHTKANPKEQTFALFDAQPPEKAIFASTAFRKRMEDEYRVMWDSVDAECAGKDHHEWFDVLERHAVAPRQALLLTAASAYLDDVPDSDRVTLVQSIKDALA